MTATQEHAEAAPQPLQAQLASWHYAKPSTDAAALRDIRHDLTHVHEKAEEIKQAPQEFHPKLVVSDHVRDKRAIADHETLIALHEMARQQLDILHGQDSVLAILNNFASKDMPGRQQEIIHAVDQILAIVGGPAQPTAS